MNEVTTDPVQPVEPIPEGEAVREVFEQPADPLPTKRKLTKRQRSELARKAAQARYAKHRATPATPAPMAEPVTVEEAAFWGEQVTAFWNQVAWARGYPMMPGSPIDPATGLPKPPDDPAEFKARIGDAAARTMRQVVPMVDERPWLQLLIIGAPYLGGALRVEYQRWNKGRIPPRDWRRPEAARADTGRPTDAGGSIRPDGEREDDLSQSYFGKPITDAGDDR